MQGRHAFVTLGCFISLATDVDLIVSNKEFHSLHHLNCGLKTFRPSGFIPFLRGGSPPTKNNFALTLQIACENAGRELADGLREHVICAVRDLTGENS